MNDMTQDQNNLPQRALGTQGLRVGAIGLGTMGMTIACGAPDEAGGIATIRRACELGVTLFDTAELYGRGTGSNEQLPGRSTSWTSTGSTRTYRSKTSRARSAN